MILFYLVNFIKFFTFYVAKIEEKSKILIIFSSILSYEKRESIISIIFSLLNQFQNY